MAILRSTRRTGWIALGIAAACAMSLIYLLGTTALDKKSSDWAKALLFLLGALTVIATLVSSEGMPWRARTTTAWLQPRPVSIIFVAIFVAFGVMTDALSLFEPRSATESGPGAIEAKLDQTRDNMNTILSRLPAPPPPVARILETLPGVWGEQNCAVTFRFEIRNESLIIASESRPMGTSPYRLVATITSRDGDVLEVRGEEPDEARGVAATFTYATNGVTERLTWDDQVSPHPSELARCG